MPVPPVDAENPEAVVNVAAKRVEKVDPALIEFPPEFVWGAATSSYQIEGAVDEGGRSRSIWDTFCERPGAIADGSSGAQACDHYHRYRADVALLADLGVDSYRFSVAWPRVIPTGSGAVNAAGLDFYDALVDELLVAGIDPAVTLYHWDLPQVLEDAGGWPNRDLVDRFVEYALAVHGRLGDRVARWITHNEPWCAGLLGYAVGVQAPGRRETHNALAASHHLLVSHGLATRALREAGAREVGITLNLSTASAPDPSPENERAADFANLWHNTLFTDPVLAGTYPELAREAWGDLSDFSFIRDGDLEITSEPIDFLGVNFYHPTFVRAAEPSATGPGRMLFDLPYAAEPNEQYERTDMGWIIEPEGLYDVVNWLARTYPGLPPVHITENGCASADEVIDGQVKDDQRVRYVTTHLAALARAVNEGVDVRGYYCWSLLDNFEWAEGYRKRFGLVHVDYDTQLRVPKESFQVFREVVQRHKARR